MLESFYKNTKINAVDSSFDEVEKIVLENDLNQEANRSKLMEISGNEETLIFIFDQEGNIIQNFGQGESNIRLKDKLSFEKIKNLAPTNKKFYITFKANVHPIPGQIDHDITIVDNVKDFKKVAKDNSILCAKFITYNGMANCLLLLESRLTPVVPAVRTLESQLLYITIIVMVLTILIALLISSIISKPLKQMTEVAGELAQGKRDIEFKGQGFYEIEELDKTLNYAVQELNKTDTLQKELLANITHDLKTPLTLIMGYAEMMKDIPEENTPENFELIVNEVNRLNELVNDLIPLTKLQAGTEVFNIEDYNLTADLKSIVERQNKLIENQGFNIEFNYDSEVIIAADPVKIEQVIYNFITNAINYSGESRKIEINQVINDDKVRISVKDYGVGISEEDLQYVWNRYYRVDKGHKRSVKGSGLGLAISLEILQYHKFEYGAESKLGEYSIFYFEAPIKNRK